MSGSHVERLFISAVLREADHITPLAAGVTEDWFGVHGPEWAFIEQYVRRYGRTPTVNVFQGKYGTTFGVLKGAENVRYLTDELRGEYLKRRLTDQLREVGEQLKAGNAPAQVLEHTQAELRQLAVAVSGSINEVDLIAHPEQVTEEVRRRVDQVKLKGSAGVPTGWPTLDTATGGAGPGELWIISARLGTGKTAGMIRWGTEQVMRGDKILFASLEQPRTQIGMRLHAFLGKRLGEHVVALDLVQGKVDPEPYEAFTATIPGAVPGNFIVDDTPRGRVTMTTLAAAIERNRPSVVYVDYITLISTRPGMDDWRALAEISAGLKDLAMTYRVPIVAAAQLNREAAGGQARAEHLARSDAIGQDADLVVGLGRERTDPETLLRGSVLKNRHGPSGGKWYLEFAPGVGIMDEIDSTRADELKEAAHLED